MICGNYGHFFARTRWRVQCRETVAKRTHTWCVPRGCVHPVQGTHYGSGKYLASRKNGASRKKERKRDRQCTNECIHSSNDCCFAQKGRVHVVWRVMINYICRVLYPFSCSEKNVQKCRLSIVASPVGWLGDWHASILWRVQKWQKYGLEDC